VSVTLQVTAPAGTPNGTYAVSVNGTNLSAVAYTASASSTLTIFTPLPASLAVSTNQATYTALQKVAINVTVMSGTVPASGVSVTVNISKASGAVVSATGTTGTNGVAVITYQVKKNDPKGMWAVTASSGSVSGTANFAVQ
jgi:MG2 domain.